GFHVTGVQTSALPISNADVRTHDHRDDRDRDPADAMDRPAPDRVRGPDVQHGPDAVGSRAQALLIVQLSTQDSALSTGSHDVHEIGRASCREKAERAW